MTSVQGNETKDRYIMLCNHKYKKDIFVFILLFYCLHLKTIMIILLKCLVYHIKHQIKKIEMCTINIWNTKEKVVIAYISPN